MEGKLFPSQLKAEKLASSDKKSQVISRGKVFRAEQNKNISLYIIDICSVKLRE